MINIEDQVEYRDSWIWPKTDRRCWEYMQTYPDLPYEINEHITNHRVVVQAGGNCGFYPKKYASLFERVYTFEPEWLNFYCLNRNVVEENVIKFQACLGDKPALVDLKVNYKNRGKNFVNGVGKYPVIQIDNLALDSCDLIHLDIEGYEYFALLGAENTIKNFKPAIVVEMWDELNNRFGDQMNDKLKFFLQSLGYKYIKTFHGSDKLFLHES